MRCEDFPCCGHYERSTGEIWCYEATRDPKDRQFDEEQRRIDEQQRSLNIKRERHAELQKAQEREHDDERCDNGENQMCADCLTEAWDAEQEYYYRDREFEENYR